MSLRQVQCGAHLLLLGLQFLRVHAVARDDAHDQRLYFVKALLAQQMDKQLGIRLRGLKLVCQQGAVYFL